MLCTHKTTSSASLVLKFVLSSTTHISTNSHPFLVGIVSLVGFLPCHQVKNLHKLEGALCQVMEVYSDNSESPTKCHKHKKNFGCAIVAIVSSQVPNNVREAKKTSQSPPKTPTNLETPTNTKSQSPKQKKSIGNAAEESRCTKNRKLNV